MYNRTNTRTLIFLSCLGLAAPGCRDDTTSVYEAGCDDDKIGWSLELLGLVNLPTPEFEVECATGWGHGVATRPSEVVGLPNAYQKIVPHPQDGLLLIPFGLGYEALWSERLGVQVAAHSLAWLDEQAKDVRWLRDDLHYQMPKLVTIDGKAELWIWGDDADEQAYLSRIDPTTGELLDRIEWPNGIPTASVVAAAWPEDGGLWMSTPESVGDWEHQRLQRMANFGTLGSVLSTFTATPVTLTRPLVDLHATPGGGVLWGDERRVESHAEDGGLRWVLEQDHGSVVVDEHDGFLLGNTDIGEPPGQRVGLTLQRRKLVDASLLWTRVHHRYEFADEPEPDDWLFDTAWSYAARADGGYLIGGGHSYPASSCLQQPIVWAIGLDGEVEWAHRVEACGDFGLPSDRVEGRALVRGYSYDGDEQPSLDVQAQWLEYFDL
jgi:hypothetical protein